LIDYPVKPSVHPLMRRLSHGYRRDTHSTRGYTEGGTELIITKPRVVKV
jgi:hypothetical protein